MLSSPSFRQNSTESSFSFPSSEMSVDEEREHFRRDTERQALLQLEKARKKPVAFAVKTNIAFDGSHDDDSPVHGCAVSFAIGDYLHVMDRYDQNWWVGRKVQIGCDIGYIPSPAKLESLKIQLAQTRRIRPPMKKQSSTASLTKLLPKKDGIVSGVAKVNSLNSSGKVQNEEEEGEEGEQNKDANKNGIQTADEDMPMPTASLIEQDRKKKGLLGVKKQEQIPPYEVVPCMRPVVIIGPSLKGYKVTDLMQKALFEHLRKKFENRIIITRVSADISLAKKNVQSNTSKRVALIERVTSDKNSASMAEVNAEIERIFELAKTLKIVVLDCDTINHPLQLLKTTLNPILVHLQITSPKVLAKLIKSTGKSQSKNMNVQIVTAERLALCPSDMWDIVLNENSLQEASDHLIGWLEDYWLATHPPMKPPGTLAIGMPLQRTLPSMTAPLAMATAGLAGFAPPGLQQQQTSGPVRETVLGGKITALKPMQQTSGDGMDAKSPMRPSRRTHRHEQREDHDREFQMMRERYENDEEQ